MKLPSPSNFALDINGQRHEIDGEHAFMMLADYLRYVRDLTGTKIVCAEGDCGACTVLCARPHQSQFFPINSCIAMMAQLSGCHILTVESLKHEGTLSLVQQAIVDHHGSQCGYCTPGFVMAITAIFEKPCGQLTPQKVKNCLTGNLCRCTGYQPLIEAACSVDPRVITPLSKRFLSSQSKPELGNETKSAILITDGDREFYAPTTLVEACLWRKSHNDAQVLSGATDVGVLLNKGKLARPRFLSLHLIDELNGIDETGDRVVVAARVTLGELRNYLKSLLPEFAQFLNLFASPQIKNMATLVGNVANGSPIADTIPFLMVTDGEVHVFGENGPRTISISDLYVGYKSLALHPDELITHISFAKPTKSQRLRLEKVSQRRDLDISTVNLALLFDFDEQNIARMVRIAVGGVFSSVVRLKKAEALLVNQRLSAALIDDAAAAIESEIVPIDDVRGSKDYRRMLVNGLFRRFCHGVLAHD